MTLLIALRRFCARHPFRRRPPSAPSSKLLIADILRRLNHMDPTPQAQAIIDQVNKLPDAIAAEVASEVTHRRSGRGRPASRRPRRDPSRGDHRQRRHRPASRRLRPTGPASSERGATQRRQHRASMRDGLHVRIRLGAPLLLVQHPYGLLRRTALLAGPDRNAGVQALTPWAEAVAIGGCLRFFGDLVHSFAQGWKGQARISTLEGVISAPLPSYTLNELKRTHRLLPYWWQGRR